jgi:hypothetical protein
MQAYALNTMLQGTMPLVNLPKTNAMGDFDTLDLDALLAGGCFDSVISLFFWNPVAKPPMTSDAS